MTPVGATGTSQGGGNVEANNNLQATRNDDLTNADTSAVFDFNPITDLQIDGQVRNETYDILAAASKEERDKLEADLTGYLEASADGSEDVARSYLESLQGNPVFMAILVALEAASDMEVTAGDMLTGGGEVNSTRLAVFNQILETVKLIKQAAQMAQRAFNDGNQSILQ